MGFRFRKSFGKGPFRINVSKSGVGCSVGTKGLRYTKKAGGGTRTTASIPGTGISYVTETSAKHPRSIAPKAAPAVSESDTLAANQGYCIHCYRMLEPNTITCPACGKSQATKPKAERPPLTGMHVAAIVIILIAIIIAFSGCSQSSNPEKVATISIPEIETIATEDPTPTREDGTPSPVGNNLEEIFADQAAAVNAARNNSESTFILNTRTWEFHKPDCRYVDEMNEENKQKFTGNRSEIIQDGYDPCGHCDP